MRGLQWQPGGPQRQLGGPWGVWECPRGSWEGLGVSGSAPEAAGRALEGKGGRKDNDNEGNNVNGTKLNGGIISLLPVQGHCPKIKAI